jgi:glycerol-3-phosphate acyltransferase PlsX
MTRIVIDAMGSDDFPNPDVVGAVLAAREYGVEIILVGDEARINPVLADDSLLISITKSASCAIPAE